MFGQALRLLSLLMPSIFLAACGQGQQTFLDRVQLLTQEKAHPLFGEVLPLLQNPGSQSPDDLMRTWKDFLGDTPVPLRQNNTTTFVYYDFTGTLNKVFLEASFAPGKPQPLWRVGSTGLFFKTYDIFKPDRVLYRFSDGTRALPDPFNPDLESVDGFWQRVTAPDPTAAILQRIVGASESGLGGQDLSVLLPPAYDRNLSWTYPFLVVVGLEGETWNQPLVQLLQSNSIRPVLVFSVGTENGGAWSLTDLKASLENRVVPWIRGHYRVAPTPASMTLVGWGKSARVVQDLAASRPDFWTKIWVPAADQTKGEDAWGTLASAYFRAQFAVVAP